MAEETKGSGSGIAQTVASHLNEDVKGWLNLMVFIGAPILLVMGLRSFYVHYVQTTPEQKACWDVKVVKERILKINQCSGDVSEVKLGALDEVAKIILPAK